MTERRKMISVYLDPEHLAGLRAIRERDGVLPAEQIRRALDAWLRRKGIRKRKRPLKPT